jgi:hypothetical protein
MVIAFISRSFTPKAQFGALVNPHSLKSEREGQGEVKAQTLHLSYNGVDRREAAQRVALYVGGKMYKSDYNNHFARLPQTR